MMSEGEIQRRLDLLLRTGCLLMESGADTSRVMRTMKRVAAYMCLPLERLNIYIVYNMLMVNLPDSRQSFTRFQRVERHGINLDTLRQASHLSCEAQRMGYSLDYYERQLSQIACQRRNYSPWQVTVAMNYAIQASLIILFIALGVAIPNVFFRRMIPA